MLIGHRIRSARVCQKMSVPELALKCNVMDCQIRAYECGIQPKIDVLLDIAKALDCSVDYLVGITDKMR